MQRFFKNVDASHAQHLSMPKFSILETLLSPLHHRRLYGGEASSGPASPPSLSGLTVGSYNVHKCIGRDGQFHPGRISQVIAEMHLDILAIQEADKRFGKRHGLLDAEGLQDHGLQMIKVSEIVEGHGWHGNAIFLREGTVERVWKMPLPGAEPRGAVFADVCVKGQSLRVVATHFGLLRRSRARQVDAIMDVLQKEKDRPTMLMGDLNEWRLGSHSSLQGFERFFGPYAGSPASFPSLKPVFALDRMFVTSQMVLQDVMVHNTPLARIASDHLPLKGTLYMRSNVASKRQECP